MMPLLIPPPPPFLLGMPPPFAPWLAAPVVAGVAATDSEPGMGVAAPQSPRSVCKPAAVHAAKGGAAATQQLLAQLPSGGGAGGGGATAAGGGLQASAESAFRAVPGAASYA